VSLVGVPPFGGAGFNREKDEKRRALRGTMGCRTGRKGETACLAQTVETPQARRLPAWGFPYRKSDDQGDRCFFKGEIFEMSGAVSADAWMTDSFKKK
jgi:hypothetical protein